MQKQRDETVETKPDGRMFCRKTKEWLLSGKRTAAGFVCCEEQHGGR